MLEQLRGVGHASEDPQPLPPVGRTNVVGTDNRPLDHIPCFGQVTQYAAEVASAVGSKERWDVLGKEVSGSTVTE